MAMIGSSYNEDNDDIGPFSHWLEDWSDDAKDSEESDFSLFSRYKEDKPKTKKRKSSEFKIKHFKKLK